MWQKKAKKLLACIMEKGKEVPTTELFLLRDATEDLSQTEVLVDEIVI